MLHLQKYVRRKGAILEIKRDYRHMRGVLFYLFREDSEASGSIMGHAFFMNVNIIIAGDSLFNMNPLFPTAQIGEDLISIYSYGTHNFYP